MRIKLKLRKLENGEILSLVRCPGVHRQVAIPFMKDLHLCDDSFDALMKLKSLSQDTNSKDSKHWTVDTFRACKNAIDLAIVPGQAKVDYSPEYFEMPKKNSLRTE